ncbi:ATP-dependent DNA helicase RecG [Patescibacteria group bacterium]|nr:ATP-dependent DNA helicase RecG [Patescibacteria group bacterium]
MELNSKIKKTFPRISETQEKALKKLGVETVRDLLYYFPSRYSNTDEIKNTKSVQKGEKVIIYARVKRIKATKAYYKKIPMTEATLEDNEGVINAVWFRQPYISKMLPEGTFAKFSGTISERNGRPYLANPEYEISEEIPVGLFKEIDKGEDNFIFPIYPESKGISSQWIYHNIKKIFESGLLDEIEDPIPARIIKKYNLPSLKTALIWIHSPKKEPDAQSARKRFAFEEIFFIQLIRQKQRKEYQQNQSFKIDKTIKDTEVLTKTYPFELTDSQKKSISQILEDFGKDYAMSRLLEGDVGSGKTAVATTTAYAICSSKPAGKKVGNLQVAYMAPTEILAKQHFESFVEYFSNFNMNIGLITSSGCRKFPSKTDPKKSTNISRTQLLKWVENGEIPILIGTHSLISKSVKFKHLAYVIVDEQHKFGTKQRQLITKKDDVIPHLLSMTATPIPRTLALTIYGDLDLTLLDQMPTGRKPIITEIVTPDKREQTYSAIRKGLEEGKQLYVICPRIEEPDPDKAGALRVKSVKAEAKKLKEEIFPEYEIDILHSKMKPSEKEEVMKSFEDKETNILVATSVVEVGVNVPNATMIIIEGAERFGLAQLHQLRGRVIRSNDQAYCFVFSDTKTQQTLDRLRALKTAKNGFELAEFDLKLRGSGELSGGKQWGISDIGMEAIKNLKMVEASRTEAIKLTEKDPELKKHPLIAKRLEGLEVHFE